MSRARINVWISLLCACGALLSGQVALAEDDCVEPVITIDPKTPNLSDTHRDLLIQAFQLDSEIPYPTCSFTLDATLEYIPSRVETFDPWNGKESPWTLISVKGREPKKRDHKKIPRYTRTDPAKAWNGNRDTINWETLKAQDETSESLTMTGTIELEGAKNKKYDANASFRINKETASLEELTIILLEPLKLNFAASIQEMTMVYKYLYNEELSAPLLTTLDTDYRFKFFVAPAKSKEHMVYQDYSCPANRQLPLCGQ